MTFLHLENLRFSRALRSRDRLVRSGRHFIYSLRAFGSSQTATLLAPSTARGTREGIWEIGNARIEFVCRRRYRDDFLLLNGGLHFVNEIPFNR